VKFGLQFETSDAEESATGAKLPAGSGPASAPAPAAVPATEKAETAEQPPKPGEGAEVVRLDRFRKK
jgi:hypothetical protein